jgi:hypothetical protein
MTPLEMIAEWRKGCSCAPAGKPEACQECTRALIDGLEIQLNSDDAAPLIVNQAAPGDLEVGDYVFASRWSDCDPCDPWAVGHVSELGPNFVVVGDASPRHWPKAMSIDHEQGNRIIEQYPPMEKVGAPLNYLAIARIFGCQRK